MPATDSTRRYGTQDPQGHGWFFARELKKSAAKSCKRGHRPRLQSIYSTRQQLHRLCVDPRIAGCENLAAVCTGAAVPIRDSAAGAPDDRNQGGHVPVMKARFDDQVDEAERQ